MSKQLVLNISPDFEPSFDNYIAGPNIEVVSQLQNMPSARAIYIWGETGSGKSHLLKAACSLYKGQYLDREQFDQVDFDQLAPIYAIDNVDTLNEDQQSFVFRLFNEWNNRRHGTQAFRIICSGAMAAMQLNIREDLRTRLGWDLVYRLELLSDNERSWALSRLCQEKGLKLGDDMMQWLFNYYTRDLSTLSNLVNALDIYSLSTKRPITLPLLKSLLAEQNEHARL